MNPLLKYLRCGVCGRAIRTPYIITFRRRKVLEICDVCLNKLRGGVVEKEES